jgi:uncharacterized protein (DUF952 family)
MHKEEQQSTPQDGEKIPYVYKIMSLPDWEESRQLGFLKILPIDEQFIHLCEEQQIPKITAKYWNEEQQIVILKLDPTKLHGQLVKENNPGGTTEYFHLYNGKIPLIAVLGVSFY